MDVRKRVTKSDQSLLDDVTSSMTYTAFSVREISCLSEITRLLGLRPLLKTKQFEKLASCTLPYISRLETDNALRSINSRLGST